MYRRFRNRRTVRAEFAGLLIIAGNMTIGMLVSFSSYMEKFFEAVSKIMELNLNKQQVMVCYERIKDILDSEQEENKGIILERPVQKIEFNQVVFGYNDNLVLKEMWISITKTGLYSLVGMQILLERYAYSEIGGTFILI